MKPGDLVKFKPGVAIWDTPGPFSPATVVGRTTNEIYIILDEKIQDLTHVKVVGPELIVGWVYAHEIEVINEAR